MRKNGKVEKRQFSYENMNTIQNITNIFHVAITKRNSRTVSKTSVSSLGGPNIDSSPFFGSLKFNIAAEFTSSVKLIINVDSILL